MPKQKDRYWLVFYGVFLHHRKILKRMQLLFFAMLHSKDTSDPVDIFTNIFVRKIHNLIYLSRRNLGTAQGRHKFLCFFES